MSASSVAWALTLLMAPKPKTMRTITDLNFETDMDMAQLILKVCCNLKIKLLLAIYHVIYH